MMHGKRAKHENRAPMIRSHSHRQLSSLNLTGFPDALDENNRWVKMSDAPWDALAEGYYQGLSRRRVARPKMPTGDWCGDHQHKLCLSDEETVHRSRRTLPAVLRGLAGYQREAPFATSLFVEIRKRMGHGVFEIFREHIDAVEEAR